MDVETGQPRQLQGKQWRVQIPLWTMKPATLQTVQQLSNQGSIPLWTMETLPGAAFLFCRKSSDSSWTMETLHLNTTSIALSQFRFLYGRWKPGAGDLFRQSLETFKIPLWTMETIIQDKANQG